VNRNATIRRSVLRGSRLGDETGLELRSVSASPARYRSPHRFAVAGEHWNRSAARRSDHSPVHDENSKPTTPLRRQGCISVSHEDLRGQDASVVSR